MAWRGNGYTALAIATATNIVGCAVSVGRAASLLQLLSSRSDAVSDGDAIVELRAPPESRWRARLNGHDVASSFRRTESGEWVALITGLRDGKSSLEVRESRGDGTKIDLIDYPLSGPIFSGPHQEPFVCQTAQNGLGPPARGVWQRY